MAKTVEYEGYTIQSRPYYDTNWDKWQIRIRISCETPQGIQTREFSSMKLEGTGTMLDLSLGGCRIESPVTVEPGVSLELRIYAPDFEWPLMIEAASVQWVSGQTFGLAFFRITEPEHQRLGQVIRNLTEEMEDESTANG